MNPPSVLLAGPLNVRVWRFGEDVNTDQIVPGRFAPYVTSQDELAKYPFVEARPEFAGEVVPGDVIVAGRNFGCGSSREYAPLALRLVGVGAICAPSFARIFARNALNLGLPLIEIDLTGLDDGAQVEFDLLGRLVRHAGANTDTYTELPEPSTFTSAVWEAGGIVAHLRAEGRLPGATAEVAR
jgi:methanogen homoaconitase small subunit